MNNIKERIRSGYVSDFIARYHKNPKYTVITHGCQMNEHDSEKIKFLLEEMGFESIEDMYASDFVIFNTCLVRENAELKVYGQLGALKKVKQENPDMLIAVCGCMMQTGTAKDVISKKYKQVDIIFGVNNISTLPYLVDRHLKTGKMIVDIDKKDDIDEQLPLNRDGKFIGYINIMTGCNNFCTYCVVPYARGREESRTPESILKEVRDLANQGYKEITLLGQNVNSYGKTLNPRISFPELLRQVNEVQGIDRIRFLTSHPKDISDELITSIRDLDKVCENIHLPFQSGSDRILKRMHRGYTKSQYLNKVEQLRKVVPNISFSTDIIVGFPGETEEDFEETLNVVREVEFEQGFTFIYSKRPGTKAALMEDQIEEDIQKERFNRLLDVMYQIFREKNNENLGTVQEVLVEGASKNNQNMLTGRTRQYKLVNFKGNSSQIGQLVQVKITECNSFALKGEQI